MAVFVQVIRRTATTADQCANSRAFAAARQGTDSRADGRWSSNRQHRFQLGIATALNNDSRWFVNCLLTTAIHDSARAGIQFCLVRIGITLLEAFVITGRISRDTGRNFSRRSGIKSIIVAILEILQMERSARICCPILMRLRRD